MLLATSCKLLCYPFNILGVTPAHLVNQLARGHLCTFLNQLFILVRISDGVERGRECEAVGRAGWIIAKGLFLLTLFVERSAKCQLVFMYNNWMYCLEIVIAQWPQCRWEVCLLQDSAWQANNSTLCWKLSLPQRKQSIHLEQINKVDAFKHSFERFVVWLNSMSRNK